jgi:signal transduction histidine kinase
LGPQGVACIVDGKGALLAHPDETLVLAHSNWSMRPVIKEWLEHPGQPTILTESADSAMGFKESVAYPIPLLKSAVVVQQPKKEVFAPLEKMRNQFILWTLVSLTIFISLAVWVSWRILEPVRQLQHAAEQLGKGNRDVYLNIQTRDELEDLGTTFLQMATSLTQLEMLRNDLLHMIVHDLKMPLSTMMATLDSLLLGDFGTLEKGQVQFVQLARRSGQEMLLLIQNLLDVGKMEEGKLKLHKERFSPRGWAENVLSGFQPLVAAAQKHLRLSIGPDLGPIEGDIALLSRVLANLISNALRHTAKVTGEVEVSLYPDGTYLAVQVRDNGEGISEEDQKHIFDKFVQGQEPALTETAAASSARTVRTGVGLGLTFCKMMVEAHGGRIAVFSQPNEGSLFTVHLPMETPFVVPDPTPETPRAIAALSTDKVG